MHLKSYLLMDSYYDVKDNSIKIYLVKNGLLPTIFTKERGAEIFLANIASSSPPRPVRAL
jgi:hypothetical protein